MTAPGSSRKRTMLWSIRELWTEFCPRQHGPSLACSRGTPPLAEQCWRSGGPTCCATRKRGHNIRATPPLRASSLAAAPMRTARRFRLVVRCWFGIANPTFESAVGSSRAPRGTEKVFPMRFSHWTVAAPPCPRTDWSPVISPPRARRSIGVNKSTLSLFLMPPSTCSITRRQTFFPKRICVLQSWVPETAAALTPTVLEALHVLT